ncbi:hypothetical protein BASA50_001389 [Batrachochytrium salamandrivorans]|uniref:Eukaryotic translation initiation factor 4E n=1 Tax=Batrachochytrium salamandrivorans TaxID=1357716 RepID=A0ABQ8EVL8_9FUNG|nr:hypothetical protein BASA62_010365 [Batrachochytrium salamandrivorans]KAH6563331.1 hypothetical protein BASA60_010738 [Batrachochytrium salamandrivorans]KAH6585039.1 hypothetical protein BASA61_007111 [Batrachochytrium salamandrivorans]KAH6587256.1 hypothetical protein BASA50_001389 [Batrachochytrium salamandrivorans]KAH9273530.1 hypothetical protein BASA83_004198 [Batrachochytrium salamandrivorans]
MTSAVVAPSEQEALTSDEQVTAFDDPEALNVKHPLQNTWTLWFDSPSKKTSAKDWGLTLKAVASFNTVEDFWGVTNNVIDASEIPLSSNLHLFKENIEPAWEDEANSKGGKWSFSIPKQRKGPELDKTWLNVMLACIGEQFTYADEITGVVVSSRKAQDRISIWTRNADDKEKCIKIGEEFKKFLQTSESISYQCHADSLKKKSSFSSDRYTL